LVTAREVWQALSRELNIKYFNCLCSIQHTRIFEQKSALLSKFTTILVFHSLEVSDSLPLVPKRVFGLNHRNKLYKCGKWKKPGRTRCIIENSSKKFFLYSIRKTPMTEFGCQKIRYVHRNNKKPIQLISRATRAMTCSSLSKST
jgi:hypothetical protein